MQTDIAIYKCIVEERLEKIKMQTYEWQSYEHPGRNMHLKMTAAMFLNVFV